MGTYRQDIRVEGVHVNDGVNTGLLKRSHAAGMVGLCVDMVHANGIGAQALHEFSIPLALLSVNERVIYGTHTSQTKHKGDMVRLGQLTWPQLVCNSCANEQLDSLVRLDRGWMTPFIPLRKNWLPSLVKNLLPTAVMVGIARVVVAPSRGTTSQESLIIVASGRGGICLGKNSRRPGGSRR